MKVVSTKRPITKPPAKDKAVLNSVRCTPRSPGAGKTRPLGADAGGLGAAPKRARQPWAAGPSASSTAGQRSALAVQ